MKTKQVNGYKITFSKMYNKFQVKKNGVCYEEFNLIEDAIKWCKNN